MKVVLSAILVLVVATLLLGGCASQQEKEVLNQAWEIVKDIDIPLPDAGYSGTTGHKLVTSEVEIKLDGYSTVTGEPYLVISCKVKDPHPLFLESSLHGEYWLVLPHLNEKDMYFTDEYKLTLTELKEYRGRLAWSNYGVMK